MRYEWLFFDLDNTLIDFDHSQDRAFAALDLWAGKSPADIAVGYDVFKKINKQLWAAVEQGQISQTHLKTERFRLFFHEIGVEIWSPDDVSAEYLQHLVNFTHLEDSVADLLQGLKERYPMAILTNGLTDVQRPKMAQINLNQYFEAVIISEEIGLAKPDPQFFHAAMDTVGFYEPSRILMVGDTLGSDIAGGQSAGLHTCWLNTKNAPHQTGIQPNYTIGNIEDILKVV